MENLEFELELDDHEIASLALLTGQPGWAVFHKIKRYVANKYITAMINVPSGSEAVLEAQRVTKVAAQTYDDEINIINKIVQGYTQSRKPEGKPIDITEGLIDLGAPASTFEDLQLSEEADY